MIDNDEPQHGIVVPYRHNASVWEFSWDVFCKDGGYLSTVSFKIDLLCDADTFLHVATESGYFGDYYDPNIDYVWEDGEMRMITSDGTLDMDSYFDWYWFANKYKAGWKKEIYQHWTKAVKDAYYNGEDLCGIPYDRLPNIVIAPSMPDKQIGFAFSIEPDDSDAYLAVGI